MRRGQQTGRNSYHPLLDSAPPVRWKRISWNPAGKGSFSPSLAPPVVLKSQLFHELLAQALLVGEDVLGVLQAFEGETSLLDRLAGKVA